MDAGNYQVHARQHAVGEVQTAVGQDVDLNAGEDSDIPQLAAGCADPFDMLQRPLIIQAVGKGKIFGVFGDRHVLITAFMCGLGHLFQGASAVGFHRVHMHVALNIADAD